MGLFGKKKHTSVASVVYNLAGDVEERPNILKTAIAASILDNAPSLTKSLSDVYLNGMGIKLRNFTAWAKRSGYNDAISFAGGTITSGNSINRSVLPDHIPHGGVGISVRTTNIDQGDYTYWTDQYVCANYPQLLDTAYTSDFFEATGVIQITFADTTTVSFIPTDLDSQARYLYVSYVEVTGGTSGAVVTGSLVTLGSGDSFPDVSTWDVISNVVTTHVETLVTATTVDVTYSDATPPTHTTSSTSVSDSYDEVHAEYRKTVELPPVPGVDAIHATRSFMFQDTVGTVVPVTTTTVTTETLPGGVIKTTTTTVVVDTIELTRTHRTDTQDLVYQSWGNLQIFIYKEGSGNAVLDAMFNAKDSAGTMFPFIPFRLNNQEVSADMPIYPLAKKAFKKATGGKFAEVMKKVNDNPSIGDIDYCYAVFGVPLNTKDRSCLKYIYEFFKTLSEDPTRTTSADYEAFKVEWEAADAAMTAWINWRKHPTDTYGYVTEEPTKPAYPPLPTNSLSLASRNSWIAFNMVIKWAFVLEEVGEGEGSPGKKVGDFWFETGPTGAYIEQTWGQDEAGGFHSFPGEKINDDIVYLYWQETVSTWRKLTICGLSHHNYVYDGKSVIIGAHEALADPEESGLIIPLNDLIYKKVGLMHGTQMSTDSCLLVFNCYESVREKWYQTTLFKIVLIIVIVVITIMTGGLAAGGVGGAIGLTGVPAAIVNIAVAMIVTRIITKFAVKQWGEKNGQIIGAILSIVTLQVSSGLLSGQSLAASFGNMLAAPNLLMLTNAVGNAYAEGIKAEAQNNAQEAQRLQADFNKQLKEIHEKFMKDFGSNGVLDPTLVADILLSPNETPASFLQRTLMVGSDIADLSIDMLHDFANITLSTDLQNT